MPLGVITLNQLAGRGRSLIQDLLHFFEEHAQGLLRSLQLLVQVSDLLTLVLTHGVWLDGRSLSLLGNSNNFMFEVVLFFLGFFNDLRKI